MAALARRSRLVGAPGLWEVTSLGARVSEQRRRQRNAKAKFGFLWNFLCFPWNFFAMDLFTPLLTHRLVLLCVAAHCFISWDVPGDVLAAPESALCGWIGAILLSFGIHFSTSMGS